MELDNLENNKPLRNEKGQLLPGQTANPLGRPKGKTLKEYQAEKFRQMSDEEKEEYLKDIPKGERWRMSEGNPKQDVESDNKTTIQVIAPQAVIDAFNIHATNQETGGGNTE